MTTTTRILPIAKVTVTKLLRAAETAKKAVKNQNYTVFTHLWMKSGIFGDITVVGFDGKTGIVSEIFCKDVYTENESFSVSGSHLINWLRLHENDTELRIEKVIVDDLGNYVTSFTVLGGKSQITLPGLHIDCKPELSDLEKSKGLVTVDAKAFTDTLNRVKKFKATNSSTDCLNGVNLQVGTSSVTLTAMDSYMVAQGYARKDYHNGELFTVIINPDDLNLPKKGKIYIEICGEFVGFTSQNGVQFTRMLPGNYPAINVDNTVPFATASKKDFADALKRLVGCKGGYYTGYPITLEADGTKSVIRLVPAENSTADYTQVVTKFTRIITHETLIIVDKRKLNKVIKSLGQKNEITLGLYQWSPGLQCLSVKSGEITYLVAGLKYFE